ncbi:MAG TPA: aminotransferase class III-fold pyridoxal phosphate-dependent enzyme [Polyangiaceae bacterium]|nr:aminotransferase class III-fold pyridoxal phosphate-dependent enzyme [Polyangiaceae bacterium]
MTDRFDETATRELELAARYPKSGELYARALQVIPGGFHLSGRPLVDPATTPMYFERGQGCRIWDVDGHEYVDYLMAFGAYLLGYARAEVDEAALEQGKKGRLLSLNHRLQVEFIESLLPLFPGAEMGAFFKTGSEATTAALRIARRRTGRRRVARCGYHGWHDWCLPLEDFVPAGLEAQVPEFNANEPRSLQAIFDTHPNDIAAVILAPEMVLPHDPRIFHELARIARAGGALFILDEVKTGLRIAPNSVAERVGIVPDMITVSKALGNGWPIAVTLGRRDVMQAAAGMHYSATFHGDVAAIAAARVTLALVQREPVQHHLERLGQMLIDGLNALARELHVPARAFGEPLPAMPFFRFEAAEPKLNAQLTRYFFQEILARGVLLHPRHMWFLSYAHREQDIAFTLDMAREALRATLSRLGQRSDELALAKRLG